ncbi:hypothetical protein [Effusibacillus lacus]|uniref:Uncharacterized protein n=1 Tax=Effusibacillus lacus TaxID=1348429 RepID=A0A292YM56_9BACL|nr:hypothetical protein [Effusibacillus lacus]TCS70977.1 hypothetical protein EDD64_12954 [Effusibacillus lacus]GAX89991.1 hypothetical protein EFBL_1617 [Effusibacillus lacus]
MTEKEILSAILGRMEEAGATLKSLDERMASLEGRMTSLEDRMTNLEGEMKSIKETVQHMSDRLDVQSLYLQKNREDLDILRRKQGN